MRTIRKILLALLLIPAVAFAQGAPRTFGDLAGLFVTILDNATAVLIVAGIVIYFYGISTNLFKLGEGEHDKMRNQLIWGLIVLFVMVSIWGILHLLQDTLFGGSGFNATNGAPQQSSGSQFGSPKFLQ